MSTSPDPSPDWAALRDALGHALDLDGPERAAFIARLDPTLQTALTEALAVALGDDPVLDHAEAVLAPLAEEATTDAYSLTTAMEGVRVGPYRIESLVGEGGMGRVYRAHRADGAFEQTVAVKVVRQALALAGSDVAARLRRERLLLATLDHPGIARLVDGGETPDGETPDGVPYLVTEFIDGVPVTDWAQAQQANTTERVELIIAVARAV
ncbi:MAG: protein kinase, partial [Bacteroidota bacterium]